MSKVKSKPFFIALLAVVLFSCSDKQPNATHRDSVESKEQGSGEVQKWTEVYSFKGNGMKKSTSFKLEGNDARLKYNYKSEGGTGMGMFSVYVVDEGDDIMKQGGIPEVMSQAEEENSESTIQKSKGNYYLHVNAVGNWTVTVEELK